MICKWLTSSLQFSSSVKLRDKLLNNSSFSEVWWRSHLIDDLYVPKNRSEIILLCSVLSASDFESSSRFCEFQFKNSFTALNDSLEETGVSYDKISQNWHRFLWFPFFLNDFDLSKCTRLVCKTTPCRPTKTIPIQFYTHFSSIIVFVTFAPGPG